VEVYAPTWSLETRAYPDVTGYWLKNILGAPTTTTGNGVITDPDGTTIPTGAYRHVFTAPYGPSGVSPMTSQLQLAYADQSVYFKAKGAASDTLSISNPDTGGVRISTGGPACYFDDISNPSLTAAYETLTIPPFLQSHITVSTWLSNAGTPTDLSVNISAPAEHDRTLGTASLYPQSIVKGDGPIVVSGSMTMQSLDVDDWNALVAGTTFSTKVRWRSTAIIASSYAYTLWNENNNCQYTGGGPDALANRRRIGASFDWRATYGGTAGSSKFTLVNATSSYA
jgi:uncharacterized protein YaiE (UPF0345 family)